MVVCTKHKVAEVRGQSATGPNLNNPQPPLCALAHSALDGGSRLGLQQLVLHRLRRAQRLAVAEVVRGGGRVLRLRRLDRGGALRRLLAVLDLERRLLPPG